LEVSEKQERDRYEKWGGKEEDLTSNFSQCER